MNPSDDDQPERSSYLRDTAMFMRSWLRTPGRTGGVWPSTRYLAHSMTKVLAGFDSPDVAELGPGTGPMTAGIQDQLARSLGGRHLAVELNADFAARLAVRFPTVEVACDSATELPRLLKERDLSQVDVVVSGLPFAAFPASLQRDVMDAVVASLHPEHGVFTTFTYLGAYSLPAARQFRQLLRDRFNEVEISPPVIRNIPPAYVLTARGVKSSGST